MKENENNMVLSVVLLTYQHSGYIEKCLDGILMQKTDFPFEIILGEDESTDGTREICIRYAEKNPDKIKLILRSRKNVILINDKPTGRFNFIESIKAASGKYIALCEGDDYWTDPDKLQKQVDFLEKNPEYVLCFHEVDVLQDGELKEDFITKETPIDADRKYLVSRGNFIHTPSVCFKNIITDFPPEFYTVPVADFFLYVLLTKHGKIGKVPGKMAVYRYGQGLYSSLQREQVLNNSILTLRGISKSVETEISALLKVRLVELMQNKTNRFLVELKKDPIKYEVVSDPGFLSKNIRFRTLIKALWLKVFKRGKNEN